MVPVLSSALGNAQRLDGGAMFGNAPRAVWQPLVPRPTSSTASSSPAAASLVGARPAAPSCSRPASARSSRRQDARPLRRGRGPPRLARLARRSAWRPTTSTSSCCQPPALRSRRRPAGAVARGRAAARWRSRARDVLVSRGGLRPGAGAPRRATAPRTSPSSPPLLEASGRLEVIARGATRLRHARAAARFRYSDGHTPGILLTERGAA
jgi:hypothetical protein